MSFAPRNATFAVAGTALLAATLSVSSLSAAPCSTCAPCQSGSTCSGGTAAPATLASHDHRKLPDLVDTAVSAGSFKTLVAAVQAAGLVEALKGEGPFTVFAPTDEAFAKLPKGTVESLLKPENKEMLTSILTYHVVSGHLMAKDVVKSTGARTLNGQQVEFANRKQAVMIDNARVIKTDIETGNGVIHVIDSVIMPSNDSIVTVASKAGSFGTLLAAATAADLADVLNSEGPFTVFAPTDEAFAKLPEGTVENLLKPENREHLKAVLTYHVVPGRVYSSDALKAGSAKTVQGKSVHISARGGRAFVNDARLVALDIDANNGVIHVIDSVMLP
ncbi:MAG: fasciclin domain-containing protein [Phycisphaerales bacterium]|nr:MAG: fasciclin domain-containing protein [Phycisphaerales bacterium]